MDNEMLYSMFLNSLKEMGDDELRTSLEKAKGLLNEKDYEKLLEVIKKERES